MRKINLPLNEKAIESLRMGDEILLSGKILTGRDQAHLRFVQALDRGEKPPVDLSGQIIYYVGPTPAKPGQPIGSAGPTTSSRMDRFTPKLLEAGLKGMIGKGPRSQNVVDAIKKYKAIYFVCVGGAGAYLSKQIRASRVIAYDDLGPESVKELIIENFPVTVAIDSSGNNIFIPF